MSLRPIRARTRVALAFSLALSVACDLAAQQPRQPASGRVALPFATEDTAFAETPPAPAREFRAAWISPVWANGMRDWPSRAGLPADSQRAELRVLLDRARDLGLNAVILHVRVAGDALYPSPSAPWSGTLSGIGGVAPEPYYDPLAFAVTEAHARGLQLHAWFNPFRAEVAGTSLPTGSTHVTRVHPEWVVHYGTQTWIDPGQPAARRAALDAILDVVRRYDVDGVHLDDYFYPYRESARGGGRDLPFRDDATWKRYGRARGWTNRADWRRSNVDAFVRSLYTEVKRTRRSVLVGISPFGIWRSGRPAGVTGLDAYGELYADARKWLAEGWVDYLAPQLYWTLDGPQDRFRKLDAWWRTQNPHARPIWPGLHTARVMDGSERWSDTEITSQIAWLRRARAGTRELPGHIHFRLAAIDGSDVALAATYAEPALVPAAPWLGRARPAAPRVAADGTSLRLAQGDTVVVTWWLFQWREADGWRSELRHVGPGPMRAPLASRALYVSAVSATGQVGVPARVSTRPRSATPITTGSPSGAASH